MGFFQNIFGNNNNDEELKQLIAEGATLVDVRTADEFASGSVNGALNIPVDRIALQHSKLNKEKTIIVFCRSGNRSAQAKVLLSQKGFKKVVNGGTWKDINSLM